MSIVPRYDETKAMAAPGFIVAIERGTLGYLPYPGSGSLSKTIKKPLIEIFRSPTKANPVEC